MAEDDVQASIRIGIDTSDALVSIKNLQRQISAFHTSMANGSAANAASAANFQKTLIDNINATKKFSASVQTVKTTTETFTNSLEKNKLSLAQYFRYAGGASKSFGRMFATEFDTINKVARERVKDLQTQYIKMGRDANGAMRAIAVRPLVLDMDNLATKTAIAAQRQQLLNQLLKQGSTNLLNFGKNTQWAGRQLMVGFTIPLSIFGSTAAKAFMTIEEQAIKFKRVYGDLMTDSGETDAMLKSIKDLASEFTKYGVAIDKTMGLAASAAAQGKTGADLTAQVAQATRLSVLGQVEQQQALDTTIAVTNAFGVAADKLAGKIDFLNAVENQTVTSIEDLTIAIPKAGPVVKQLGGDVEDLSFFLTAMKEGGINASEGANALKSGLASLINPTEKASGMLAAYGINIKKIVEGNKGDIKGIVIDFATALDKLDPLARARAIEQLFGKFQFSRLSTLFQNVIGQGTQAQKVLELAGSTSQQLAALSTRELNRISESPMFKFKKSIEDIKAALAPIGETFLKIATPVIEFGTKILNAFNALDDKTKTFVTGLIAVVGGIGPILLMTFGLLANGLANIIKGFTFVKNIFNKTAVSSNDLGSQISYMTSEQLTAASVAASLDQVHGKLTQTFTSEASAIRLYIEELRRANTAAAAFNVPAVGRSRPMKLASGIVSVPGPKGAGDVVPAMLSPEEAVIPAKPAKKYRGLIQGIIADNIPGYSGGRYSTQATHVAGAMPHTPEVVAQVERFQPGFSGLPKEMQDFFDILSDLTSDKSRALNQAARGTDGMGSEQFLAEWSSSPEGLRAVGKRAEMAGEMLVDSANNSILDGLDAEIGRVTAGKIRNLGASEKKVAGWLDRLIQESTTEVVNRAANSSDSKVRNVSSGLQARAKRVASIRYRPKVEGMTEDQIIKDQMSRGLIERRGRGFFASGTKIKTGRLAYSTDKATREQQKLDVSSAISSGGNIPVPIRGTSAAYGSFKNQPGGTYEGSQSQKSIKQYGILAAKDLIAAETSVLSQEKNDPFMLQRSEKRNSPHPQAGVDGADDAKARVAAEQKVFKRESRRVQGVPTGNGGMSIVPVLPSQAQQVADAPQGRVSRRVTRPADLEVRQAQAQDDLVDSVEKSTKVTKENTKTVGRFGSAATNAILGITSISYALSGVEGPLGDFSAKIGQLSGVLYGLSFVTEMLTKQKILETLITRKNNAVAATKSAFNVADGVGLFANGGKGFFKNILTNFSKFSMFFKNFVGISLRFAGLIGIAITAFSLLNGAVQDTVKKQNSYADALKIPKGQGQAVASYFGVAPKESGFGAKVTPTATSVDTRTEIQKFKDSEEFKGYQAQIDKLKTANKSEATNILQGVTLNLQAQGVAKEQIDAVLIALQEEAGRRSLNLRFSSFDITSKEGQQGLQKKVAVLAGRFAAVYSKGITEEIQHQTDKNGNPIDVVVRNFSSSSLGIAAQTATGELIAGATQGMEDLAIAFKSGLIDSKTYTKQILTLGNTLKGLPQSSAAFKEIFTELAKTDPTAKLALGIKDSSDQMMVLQALSMGLGPEFQTQITLLGQQADTMAELLVQEAARKDIQTGITTNIKAITAAIKAATGGADTLGGTIESAFSKALKQIKENTAELFNQVKAFNKLSAAGYNAEEAFKIAKDPILAAALAAEKVGSKNWKALTAAIKKSEAAAKSFAAVQRQTLEGAGKEFDDSMSSVNEKFAALEEGLQLKFNKDNKSDNDLITNLESQIAGIEYSVDDLNASLDDIQLQEDVINKKYDDRVEALDKIQSANDEIARQQKSQLTLAGALSSGDIAAAAAAMQEAQAQDAQASLDLQRKNIENARSSEIGAIKVGGKTRSQIENELLDLQKQIKKIEEDSLEPARERIRKADEKLQKDIAGLMVAEKTKLEWDLIGSNIRIAKTETDAFNQSLEAVFKTAENLARVLQGLGAINATGTTPRVDAKITPAEYQRVLTAAKKEASSAEFGGSGIAGPNIARLLRMADGGQVSGLGTGTSDSIPAWLSNGEYVIKASAVKNIGVDTLEAMNNAPKFANGGFMNTKGYSAGHAPVKAKSKSIIDNVADFFNKKVDVSAVQNPIAKPIFEKLFDAKQSKENKSVNKVAKGLLSPILGLGNKFVGDLAYDSATSAVDSIINLGANKGSVGDLTGSLLSAIPGGKGLATGAKGAFGSLVSKTSSKAAELIASSALKNPSVGVRLPLSRIEEIVRSGGLKNVFESQRAAGWGAGDDAASYLSQRKFVEEQAMGIPSSAPAELRPLYGFVYKSGLPVLSGKGPLSEVTKVLSANNPVVSGYGEWLAKLKNVSKDSTYSVGDTFRSWMDPVSKFGKNSAKSKQIAGGNSRATQYVESQFPISSGNLSNLKMLAPNVREFASFRRWVKDNGLNADIGLNMNNLLKNPKQNISQASDLLQTAMKGVLRKVKLSPQMYAIRKIFDGKKNANNDPFGFGPSFDWNTVANESAAKSLFSNGGMVSPKYFANGGFARGTDTIPAMLSPGEFVVKKYAVQDFGTDRLKAINNGTYSGESVYNYELNVNVKSDANADEIARTVIAQIKQIDSQRLRGNRL